MKNLFLCLLLMSCLFAAQGQNVTQLKEARITYEPNKVKVSSNLQETTFTVNENYAGEFTKDPIKFMKENFDMDQFRKSVAKDKFDSYIITFRSRKGFLDAYFDKKGTLVKNSRTFKNILLPLEVRNELYNNNKGWSMVKNTYNASGKEDKTAIGIYRIKMKNGNKSHSVKIYQQIDSENYGVVNN